MEQDLTDIIDAGSDGPTQVSDNNDEDPEQDLADTTDARSGIDNEEAAMSTSPLATADENTRKDDKVEVTAGNGSCTEAHGNDNDNPGDEGITGGRDNEAIGGAPPQRLPDQAMAEEAEAEEGGKESNDNECNECGAGSDFIDIFKRHTCQQQLCLVCGSYGKEDPKCDTCNKNHCGTCRLGHDCVKPAAEAKASASAEEIEAKRSAAIQRKASIKAKRDENAKLIAQKRDKPIQKKKRRSTEKKTSHQR